MTATTDEHLNRLERLVSGADRGPWRYQPTTDGGGGLLVSSNGVLCRMDQQNGEFFAESVAGVLSLLAEVRSLRARLASLGHDVSGCHRCIPVADLRVGLRVTVFAPKDAHVDQDVLYGTGRIYHHGPGGTLVKLDNGSGGRFPEEWLCYPPDAP